MRWILLFAFLAWGRVALAQTNASASTPGAHQSEAISPLPRSQATTAQLQAALDQLTQSNRDLLDLLKKQQTVLEDIQFDRRQQSRHLESLEERLTEAQLQNAQLQNKVANLEADASVRPPSFSPGSTNSPADSAPNPSIPAAGPAVESSPPAPSNYLPTPESEGAPGTKSWHRLFTLKGTDAKKSDLFPIQGQIWRVLWHNQDQPGKRYQNTSALFINAFPKDDTIPQKVCAKLGSGGDSTELEGPGNYYLKIEASGGSWELAVEDFR